MIARYLILAVSDLTDYFFQSILDLSLSNLILQNKHDPSCAVSLVIANLSWIKLHCGYTVIHQPLRPQIFKLTQSTVLLSNVSKTLISCNNGKIQKTFNISSIQEVYELQCVCQLMVAGYIVSHIPSS